MSLSKVSQERCWLNSCCIHGFLYSLEAGCLPGGGGRSIFLGQNMISWGNIKRTQLQQNRDTGGDVYLCF